MTKPIDTPQYTDVETELAKRVMCAHITLIQGKPYEECWQQYVEPAERIEEYYLSGARSILQRYADDHKKGTPESAGSVRTN